MLTGETVTPTIGAMTEIVAVALLVGSITLVAVSTAVVLEVTTGAVYKPLLETVPLDTFQLTTVFHVCMTVAWNWAEAPEFTIALAGAREMETAI